MNLTEILKKNEKKLKNSEINVRKPEISRKDRPYSEFLLPPQAIVTLSNHDNTKAKEKELPVSTIVDVEHKENKIAHTISFIESQTNQSTNNYDVKLINIISNEYLNLSGNEKKFMDYICEISIRASDLEVGPIGVKEIIEDIGIKEKSIKQTINRLKKKGFLQKSSKRGKGGWRIFILDPKTISLYQKVLKKKELNYIIKNSKSNEAKDLPSVPKFVIGLPKEWEELDISGLDKFGFTRNHLIQLYQDISSIKDDFVKETMTIDSIQHSIYCFRWDLQNYYSELKEKYSSPIKMFVGSLRKGRPYNSIKPETFKTPEQIEWEMYHKQIEKKKAMFEQIKQQAFSTEFDEWHNSLSEIDIQEILPEDTKRGLSSVSPTIKAKIVTNVLHSHFEKYVWPDRCKKFLSIKQ